MEKTRNTANNETKPSTPCNKATTHYTSDLLNWLIRKIETEDDECRNTYIQVNG